MPIFAVPILTQGGYPLLIQSEYHIALGTAVTKSRQADFLPVYNLHENMSRTSFQGFYLQQLWTPF